MTSSLLNFVNNLAEGIHKIKSKYRHDNKKNTNPVALNAKIVSAISNTQTSKMFQ